MIARASPAVACLAAGAAARCEREAAGPAGVGMWHGARKRLHAGSLVAVRDAAADGALGGLNEVRGYDASAEKWVLAVPRAGGRLVGVAEERVALAFCVVPENAAHVEPFWGGLGVHDASQDRCGAGLATRTKVDKGQPLFAEYPYVVAGRDRAHRWAAYVHLKSLAKSGDDAAAEALAHFDAMTYDASEPPAPETARAAARLVDAAIDAAGGGAALEGVRAAEVDTVLDVLRKYEGNQFLFEHGGDDRDATALYRLTAKMNHSCAPSVVLEPTRSPQNAGKLVPGDGMLLAKAAAALEPGEPLCICYGPKDLLQWDLAKRRSWLKAHCGFACACPRCLLEEAAQASGAAARPRTARWWPW